MSNDNKKEGVNKIGINYYPGHMAKTKRLIKENLKYIDIIYEVVDSRMPKSSKIIDIDDFTGNKPRLMIMTKADLCDKTETEKWLNHYENEGYKVILIDLGKGGINQILKTTENMLKDKWKEMNSKGLLNRKARVLVMGIPNVGKSTLINRLAGKKVAATGNKPGITKNVNWIRVNEKIELLDSPGILWPKLDQKDALNLASLTAIKEETLPLFDVACYILKTLEKYYKPILKERYNLEKLDEDIILSIEKIGQKRGCLIKGGEVDYDKAISLIINDVKNGYIKGVTFDRYE